MLPRFHHILVPLSLSTKNKTAVDIAFDLAVHNKASISLLHVVQSIEAGTETPDRETSDFYEHISKRAESELEALSRRFLEADIQCEFKVRIGDRMEEIVQFAHDHRVDLIVMSSHRVDPDRLAETWGTLSYKVSVICDCPILLVK